MVKADPALINSPEAFAARFAVSRETLDRLKTYETLLKRWQKTINLVAPSTLDQIWHRHFADSAQVYFAPPAASPSLASPLEGEVSRRDWGEAPVADPQRTSLPLVGRARVGGLRDRADQAGSRIPPIASSGASHTALSGISPTPNPSPQGGGGLSGPLLKGGGAPTTYLDIGSGAGFPGLVIAILAAEQGGTRHTLIESDSRKAAFLREVARTTGVVVDILCTRIESSENHAKVGAVNCVTARALAPLPRLIELAYPYFGPDSTGLFLKGRDVAAEIEEAERAWSFAYELKSSVTDKEGRVLLLQSLRRTNASQK